MGALSFFGDTPVTHHPRFRVIPDTHPDPMVRPNRRNRASGGRAVRWVALEAARARQVVDHPRPGARAEAAPPSSGGMHAGAAEEERD